MSPEAGSEQVNGSIKNDSKTAFFLCVCGIFPSAAEKWLPCQIFFTVLIKKFTNFPAKKFGSIIYPQEFTPFMALSRWILSLMDLSNFERPTLL